MARIGGRSAWLAWWENAATEAAAEGNADALRRLSEANAAAWDGLARHSAETEAVIAEATRAVKAALEA